MLVVRQRWLLAVSQVENIQFGSIPELALGLGCLTRNQSLPVPQIVVLEARPVARMGPDLHRGQQVLAGWFLFGDPRRVHI